MEAVVNLDAEMVMERLRMALAELGYKDAPLYSRGIFRDGWPAIALPPSAVPDAVWWTASSLVYDVIACWACWNARTGTACINGNCAHPDGPARPPRELLRAAS